MKKLIILGVGIAVLMFSAPAFAITIDGNLGDWGVTPFTDWAPDSDTTDWIEQNNYNLPPSHGFLESWDIEAMYFDNDADYLYFAIVTSKDQSSGMGDLAIDLNGDGEYEWGVDLTHFGASNHVRQRDFLAVTDWHTRYGGREYNIPYRVDEGTVVGTAEVFQRNLGWIEPGVGYRQTYVLEGRIDTSLLGALSLCGLPVEIAYAKISCLRDYLILNGDCDGDCGVIPEPTTLLLLGSGLLGLGGLRKRSIS